MSITIEAADGWLERQRWHPRMACGPCIRRGVSPDTAMRLARCFGGDARSWLNLQTAHDLRLAEIEKAKEIERTVEPLPHSA